MHGETLKLVKHNSRSGWDSLCLWQS